MENSSLLITSEISKIPVHRLVPKRIMRESKLKYRVENSKHSDTPYLIDLLMRLSITIENNSWKIMTTSC